MNSSAKSTALQRPIDKLLDVMGALRDPDNGCPWDLEQTFGTIAPHTIEEAYEVADAIDRQDMDDLKDELGDLLFQVVYYAQMAKEEKLFTFDDIARHAAEKMISRHPHVFGEAEARSASDVNAIWDQQKDKEKTSEQNIDESVPANLPSLLRAQKLQKKAARKGFEWPDSQCAFDKLEEEIREFKEAAAERNQEHMEEELGDLLFCLVNYARMTGLNSEEALRKTNAKFIKRFNGMEKEFKADDQKISDASLDQMLDSWKRQK